ARSRIREFSLRFRRKSLISDLSLRVEGALNHNPSWGDKPMNGSKGYQASDAAGKTLESLPILSLETVQRMLPLVQRIVDDCLASQLTLRRLQPEEGRLDRKRHS